MKGTSNNRTSNNRSVNAFCIEGVYAELLKLTLACVSVSFLFSSPSFALKESNNGRCTLSAEVLADPDAVILDAMENAMQDNSLNCSNRPIAETEKKPLPQPHYPLRGNKLKGAGWGVYRNFRILGSKPGEPLEGHETRIYDVELIYVAMIMDGPTRPICEKARIPMRMVNTPWGWRLMPRHPFGSSLKGQIHDVWHWDDPQPKRIEPKLSAWHAERESRQKKLETFAAQCKLQLTEK